jgi:hypothetical protein
MTIAKVGWLGELEDNKWGREGKVTIEMQASSYELEHGRAPPQTAVRRKKSLIDGRAMWSGSASLQAASGAFYLILTWSRSHDFLLLNQMDAEYEVGASTTPRSSIPLLWCCTETILKAKVFMKGKKMGWVGSVFSIYLHPLICMT